MACIELHKKNIQNKKTDGDEEKGEKREVCVYCSFVEKDDHEDIVEKVSHVEKERKNLDRYQHTYSSRTYNITRKKNRHHKTEAVQWKERRRRRRKKHTNVTNRLVE